MSESMRDLIRDELAGWPIGSGYYATAVSVEDAREMADAVLAVLADPPAYLALDLWMALGLSPRDFDAYLERNGWADTWANLLDGVRRKSGRRGCSKHTETPRERCVLIAGHVGPCMGASDVGSSERLPGAAFEGEQA